MNWIWNIDGFWDHVIQCLKSEYLTKNVISDPGCFHCQTRNEKGKCLQKSSNSSLCVSDIDGTVCIRNNETQEHCEYEGK